MRDLFKVIAWLIALFCGVGIFFWGAEQIRETDHSGIGGVIGMIIFIQIAIAVGKGIIAGVDEPFKRIEQEEQEKERIEREKYREKHRILEKERRDADVHNSPYTYECVEHSNETLAIRYGIANLNNTIKLQKIRKVKDDPEGNHYLAKLVDFGNREVIVVINPGTEDVQTFYPMSEDWFNKYADLELVLKDNKTFDLKELAHFHVQKVVINS